MPRRSRAYPQVSVLIPQKLPISRIVISSPRDLTWASTSASIMASETGLPGMGSVARSKQGPPGDTKLSQVLRSMMCRSPLEQGVDRVLVLGNALLDWTVEVEIRSARPGAEDVLGEHPPVVRIPDVPAFGHDDEDVLPRRQDHLGERRVCIARVLEAVDARDEIDGVRLDRHDLPGLVGHRHVVGVADVAARPWIGFHGRVVDAGLQEPGHEPTDS